jgi:H+-transporting ATPase
MHEMLSIATILGIVGPIASFGLFYIGIRVLALDQNHLQTMMYLLLSVSGHLTIFLSRTRGPFWSIRPAKILLLAVLGTQGVATLFAVTGIFMNPIPVTLALLVWGYALVWFFLTDRIKILAYRFIGNKQSKTAASPGQSA